MNPPLFDPDASPPTAAFLGWVQQVLDQLNDLNLLQRHPLNRELQPERATDEAGGILRARIIDAIEAIKPMFDVPANAPMMRSYDLLRAHYVEGITIQKAAERMNLSLRQSYRDLRRGEEKVAELLWRQRQRRELAKPIDGKLSRIDITTAEHRNETVELRSVLERARTAVNRLAMLNAVTIELFPDPEVALSIDPSAAHQVFVSLMSHAVQHARPGPLSLRLSLDTGQVMLAMAYETRSAQVQDTGFDPAIVALSQRLGWTIDRAQDVGERCITRVHIPVHTDLVVLVIDDHEGLGRLLERYLSGERYQVIQATSAAVGIRMAGELQPDVILLDIMMPEVDGWEVLQTLHNQPRTATIPIILCSVVNDPELAYSLGAMQLLRKPFSRDDVVSALRQVSVEKPMR